MEEKLDIFVNKSFLNLTRYIGAVPNVTLHPYFNPSIQYDYIFGMEDTMACSLLPKNGFVVKGNQLSFNISNYKIEHRWRYDNETYFFFRKIDSKQKYQDVTFIVQGLSCETTIDSICILFLYANIVISTWEYYDFPSIEQIVQTHNYFNNQNVYYQIYTTLNGLYKVPTKYSIKIRADEILTSYDDFIKNMFKNISCYFLPFAHNAFWTTFFFI
jgi:hypothetical protein